MTTPEEPQSTDFETLANQQRELTIVEEFWQFVRENRNWWLIPMLVVFLGLGVLVMLSSTSVAPFIYTLF